jgi:hypothetical protein
MNPVILISSCKRDQEKGYHEVIRETWGKVPVIPFFFLLGDGATATSQDEVVLPVPDDYNSLPYKTREGHRWARKQGHDWVFQAFTDTYIDTNRLLNSGFEQREYSGHFRGETSVDGAEMPLSSYPSGGSGYWMSPRFTDLMLKEEPDHWAEDLWIGRVSKKHQVIGIQDTRYWSGGGQILESNNAITVHLSRGTDNYEKGWMTQQHLNYLRRV